MHILIFFSHPQRDSLTGKIMDSFVEGLNDAGHTTEIADLYRENFQPALTEKELVNQFINSPMPDDIRAEQERYEKCDAIALVFPIWWWSVPAMMKGWIERVFSAGWAYPVESDTDSSLLDKRKGLVLCTAGGSEQMYKKYGTADALKQQLEIGTFSYFGVEQVNTHIFHKARVSLDMSAEDRQRREEHIKVAYEIGRGYT